MRPKDVDLSGGIAVYLIHSKPARRIRQATRICAELPELDRQEAESLGKISVAGSGFARYEVFPGSVTRCSAKNQAEAKCFGYLRRAMRRRARGGGASGEPPRRFGTLFLRKYIASW